ncbi:putative protein N(5)-glutamine methyltransferase [Brevibacillus fluminis]|uniref:putative protein N(5)-glutamine methyltransferase n=1 Tax=Brevibacillus fluminis TaxID=511487 RepID=UPI003F8B1071
MDTRKRWTECETTISTVVTRLRHAGCVFAEEEARLLAAAAQSPVELEAMVEQRVMGFPLEHITGWAAFCGVKIMVEKGVFVPRHRTEFLVRQAAARLRKGAIVVDLCCGSGAIGTVLAARMDQIELHAADIDPAAVTCARRNVTAYGGTVYEGDLYKPLPPQLRGRINILVANAPYVPTGAIGTMPPEARLHEAPVALDGGADGLDIQRRIASEAALWLAPGGELLVETSERQTLQTVRIFEQNGLFSRVTRCDDLDATVVIGTKPDR